MASLALSLGLRRLRLCTSFARQLSCKRFNMVRIRRPCSCACPSIAFFRFFSRGFSLFFLLFVGVRVESWGVHCLLGSVGNALCSMCAVGFFFVGICKIVLWLCHVLHLEEFSFLPDWCTAVVTLPFVCSCLARRFLVVFSLVFDFWTFFYFCVCRRTLMPNSERCSRRRERSRSLPSVEWTSMLSSIWARMSLSSSSMPVHGVGRCHYASMAWTISWAIEC